MFERDKIKERGEDRKRNKCVCVFVVLESRCWALCVTKLCPHLKMLPKYDHECRQFRNQEGKCEKFTT